MKMENKWKIWLIGVVCLTLTVTISGVIPGATAQEKKGTIFYSVCFLADPFFGASVEAMREETESLGYELKAVEAENLIEKQLDQIEDIILTKPAAIVISPVDCRAIISAVDKVRAAGIPVIVLCRTVTETKVDFTSIAGTIDIGRLAAISSIHALKEKYGEYRGLILEIEGDLGDAYTIEVHEGFTQLISLFPHIEVIVKSTPEWRPEAAADTVDDLLTARPDIDLIFSHSDWLVQGFVATIERLGYGPVGSDKHMILVSTGAMAYGLPFIREGWMDATVEEPITLEAKMAALYAVKLAEGEEIKPGRIKLIRPGTTELTGAEAEITLEDWGPMVRIPGRIVDKSNVDDPSIWGNIVARKE